MFVDQAAQDGFLAVEGRWGLRFPTPGTSQLEEAATNLFRHSYPQSVTVTPSRLLKASPDVQIDANSGEDVLDGAGLMRGCTPSRMGFAGNSVGEMAYITNLMPSSIRPRQVGNRWSREACFTPLQGQRSWEHGMNSDCGVIGPPSRHVQTRAGRVVEEAKQRAMQLTSPRQALSVRDDAGNYRHLNGLVTCPVDATPLELCSPFPGTLNGYRIFIAAGQFPECLLSSPLSACADLCLNVLVFCTAANDGLPGIPKETRLWTPPSQWSDAEVGALKFLRFLI